MTQTILWKLQSTRNTSLLVYEYKVETFLKFNNDVTFAYGIRVCAIDLAVADEVGDPRGFDAHGLEHPRRVVVAAETSRFVGYGFLHGVATRVWYRARGVVHVGETRVQLGDAGLLRRH